jgi:hypothetical protein
VVTNTQGDGLHAHGGDDRESGPDKRFDSCPIYF